MLLIPFALLGAPAHGARLTVDPAGGGDYLSLTSALADARIGDYIALSPGSHTGGAQVTRAIPIVGLGERPQDTELSGASIGLDLRAGVRVENLLLSGSSYGLYSYGVEVDGRRLVLEGAYPLYAYLSTIELLNVAFYGGQVYSQSATLSGAQLSFVDSSLYASSSAYPVDLVSVVGNDLTLTCASTGIPMSLSYALYSSGSIGSCTTQSSVFAGFDTGWSSYTGDPRSDDLSLLPGSTGVDRGPTGCRDVDGTVCDLGHLGGRLGQDADLDADGIPDAYEVKVGLDATLANGEDDDDGDGLDNLGEYLFGTHALLADSDGDGAEDQEELSLGFDPLDPSDQGPIAILRAPAFGRVNAVSVLDASGSRDPTNDRLSYRIFVRAAPAASALAGTELSMGGALAPFTPDAVGIWSFELQVSDGINSDTTSLEWRVRDVGSEIHVPEDFEELDDALAVFRPGDSVVIGPGAYALSATAASSLRDLRMVGAGMEHTLVSVDGELQVQDLELQDLELQGDGDNYLFFVQGGEHLALSRVRTSGARYGVYASDVDWVSVEGSELGGSNYAFVVNGVGTVGIARSRFTQSVSVSVARRLRMQGVWVDTESTSDGLAIHQVDAVALSNLSVSRVSNAITVSSVDALAVDHLYLQQVAGQHCVPGAFRQVMVNGALTPLAGCDVVGLYTDGAGLDISGVPSAQSLAWDGGAPFDLDPDGTRRDVGWTGGPHGMRFDPELADPWEDLDGDGLSALSEWVLDTDPALADSDGDGVGDRSEVVLGQDPADPSDNVAVLNPRPVRLRGAPASVDYSPMDPQGEACEMVWEDGHLGGARELPELGPARELLAFEITCGEGRSQGELLVLREEDLRVPGDYPSLLEALEAAQDHHRILLDEGVWEVGALRLSGKEVAISGQGDAWISGELEIEGLATSLTDLGLSGGLRSTAGGLLRVEVRGDLITSQTWLRNVLVHGDLHAAGGSAANLSVVGDLVGDFSDLRSSASGGVLQVGAQALGSHRLQASPAELWIHPSEAADEAILMPWPGSPLWDAGSQQAALEDLDGSREDIGWTGGPEARDHDLDQDGLPDPYEAWAGVSEPDEDEDEDGWDNAREFAEGTDPLNWDSDGDRLMDSVDPEPLVASGAGLSFTLRASDAFPERGDWVEVRADLRDPAGRLGEIAWSVETPARSAERMEIEGDSLFLNIDAVGAWQVQAQIEVEGEPRSALLTLYTQDPVLVPLTTPLERAIDEARPGQVLLLEGGPREVSGLVVDKDLVLRHQDGSGGVLNSDLLAPIVEVKDGARLRLQGITLRAGTELPAVLATGATLEMRQASIIGGQHNIHATQGAVVDVQGSLLSLPDEAALKGEKASFHLEHSNFGWSNDEEDPGLLFDLSESTVTVRASVPQWSGVSWTLCRATPCAVLVASSLLPEEELSFLDPYLQVYEPFYGEPGFLRSPSEDTNPAGADMRLNSSAEIRDALDTLDWDGSPGDLGMYGGPWGDWPNVDNDRDGYTNLEGDCDDGDPEVVPNLLSGECELRTGCATQGSGSAPWGLLVGLLALLWRGRRESPVRSGQGPGATGSEID